MKHFLTFLSSVLLPLACVGAPSYTTYFNNTHTYTNASVAGTARVNSLVVTNGISSAANWTGEGTTNSTLSGEWRSHNGILTNALVIGRGTNSGDDFIDAVRDTSQGDINDGEFRFRVTDGSNYGTLRNYATTNSTGFRWETKRGSNFLRLGADLYADGVGDFNWLYMDVNSVTPVLLDPLNQYGLNLPFKFGTAATISSGNILGVYNNETNVFSVGYDGGVTASGAALVNSITATNGGTFRGEIVSTLGTITADASALDATATWNNAGVTFTGLKMNITDAASAAASLLMDLQVGGNSLFAIGKTPFARLAGSTGTSPGYGARIIGDSSSRAAIGLNASNEGQIAFGAGSSLDTILIRDAANVLAMRNGTAAQRLNEYGTFTDASNYRRGYITTSTGGVFGIGSEGLGTGATGNSIQFLTDGTARWNISSSGHILAAADNTYDIGASGATRPRSIYTGSTIFSGGSVLAASANSFQWTSRSQVLSPSDGVIGVYNNAATDFNRIQFGGTSASFPALKRSSTELQVRLADDSADGPLKSGQLSNTGIRVMTPSSLQTLAAGNALLANATKVRVVGSGGAVTLTSTPTIADGSDGQYVMIQGTDNTNTLTVQDQGSLASSNLELGAASRVLGAGDVLVLTFDTTASVWYEVSFANN